MKKNAYNLFKFFIFSLITIMCVFFTSCGLDVYYILYPPSEAKVVNEETDALGRYFSFKTADVENASMDIFTGTVVLYKIYNNQSQMISDSFSINNYNEELSEKGYNRAYALGYQQLNISNNDTPLVAKSGQNRTVEIRLFTEGYIDDPYEAGIKVSGQYIMDGNDYAIPLRENNTTFAFYSSSKNTVVNGVPYSNNIPNQEDIDVKYTQASSEADDVWYVNAYAVSVGMTSDFSYKHSALEPLGYIVIDKSDFNN